MKHKMNLLLFSLAFLSIFNGCKQNPVPNDLQTTDSQQTAPTPEPIQIADGSAISLPTMNFVEGVEAAYSVPYRVDALNTIAELEFSNFPDQANNPPKFDQKTKKLTWKPSLNIVNRPFLAQADFPDNIVVETFPVIATLKIYKDVNGKKGDLISGINRQFSVIVANTWEPMTLQLPNTATPTEEMKKTNYTFKFTDPNNPKKIDGYSIVLEPWHYFINKNSVIDVKNGTFTLSVEPDLDQML